MQQPASAGGGNQELFGFLAQNSLLNPGAGGIAAASNHHYERFSSSAVPPMQQQQQQQQQQSSSSYNYPYLLFNNNNNNNNLAEVSAAGSAGVVVVSNTTSTDTANDRALAALNNHKEAEKRRRERINSHLDKLRALLPCNSKTDKASLLAKVVERVKELKQQMSEITQVESLPSETDEITVLCSGGNEDPDDVEDYSSNNGGIIFKASLSCEDRPELLPDLIEILKSLHLKTLKAEMATLGGRIRSVLIVAADKDHTIESVPFLQNAFKSLLERSNSSERSKRRRRVLDPTLLL